MSKTKKIRIDLTIKIGQNIRKWRELKSIKQEHLAKLLGITKGALSNIETDKADITFRRIEEIAKHLGIDTTLLLRNPIDFVPPPRKMSENKFYIYKLPLLLVA